MGKSKKAATSYSKVKQVYQPKQAVSEGYKGHLVGRRKGKVHELFDKQGAEAAWTLGLKLGLKQGTLRSWFGAWGDKTRKPTAKANNKTDTSKTATGAAASNQGAAISA